MMIKWQRRHMGSNEYDFVGQPNVWSSDGLLSLQKAQ